jgi:hypothetical protein
MRTIPLPARKRTRASATRVRWEPRVGRLKRRYDNIVVPVAVAYSVVRIPVHLSRATWSEVETAFERAATITSLIL